MQIIQRYAIPDADVTTSVTETGTAGTAWAVGTTYSAGQEVIRDNRIFVSAVDGNVGIDPLTVNQNLVSAPWIFRAFTIPFRCFDGTISSRTIDDGPVTITVDNIQGQNSIMLFGVFGSALTITGFDVLDVEVYNKAETLSAREVNNWYDWFFLGFGESRSRLAFTDVPPNVVRLTFVFSGARVEIGELVIGRAREIGRTLHQGTTTRVVSLTRVDFNAYGEPTVIPAPTRVETTYAVHITKARMQAAYDLLESLSGQVVGAIGSADRQTTIQLGFLSLEEIPEDLPSDYIATLTLRGVI